MRPTTMILGEDNRKRWSFMDIMIMQAYEIFKSEICTRCGKPIWICHNEDIRLQARIKEDKCWVKEEIDEYERRHADDETSAAAYAEIYSRDDTPFYKFRSTYYAGIGNSQDDGGEEG